MSHLLTASLVGLLLAASAYAQDYSTQVRRAQIPPELLRGSRSGPRIGARLAGGGTASEKIRVENIYHDGQLYLSEIRKSDLKGCTLRFREFNPKYLPGFGDIMHMETVFEFVPGRPLLRLQSGAVAADGSALASSRRATPLSSGRLTFSAEPEEANPNLLRTIGLGARYPMIYRVLTHEEEAQEMIDRWPKKAGESPPKTFDRRILSKGSVSARDLCWQALVRSMQDATRLRDDQLARARGERTQTYDYLSFGTNCVSVGIEKFTEARGDSPVRLPSLPKSVLWKNWSSGAVELGPPTALDPRELWAMPAIKIDTAKSAYGARVESTHAGHNGKYDESN